MASINGTSGNDTLNGANGSYSCCRGAGNDMVSGGGGSDTLYGQMLSNAHEIIFAEGAETESFHPGDTGLSAIAPEARDELFTLFGSAQRPQQLWPHRAALLAYL